KGQHVTLSMLDTVVSFLWSSDMGGHTFVGDESANEAAQSFIDLIYQTADGHISVAVMRHTEWVGLARAVEHPEWLDDPRFQDTAGLERHKNARLELTQSALRKRSTADWLQRLEAEDVPCAPILSRKEMVEHAQIRANRILTEVEHPQAGRLRQARTAATFSETPAEHRYGAPLHGGHGREILQELGYEVAAIEQMVRDRVIVVPEDA
ncbi:MAG: CoA transferase, partial [Gammaproteobacteria bacterium]|nr:CoA transferase [Gammaproteobacteria bacterium]